MAHRISLLSFSSSFVFSLQTDKYQSLLCEQSPSPHPLCFKVTSTLAARLGPVLLDTHTIFCQTVAVWYMPALGQATAATTLVRARG